MRSESASALKSPSRRSHSSSPSVPLMRTFPPSGHREKHATVAVSRRIGAQEIQVERVKFLHYGEARGDYDQVVATLNAADPHGK